MATTTMVHVRVDETLKNQAAETLAAMGLSLSDAVRVFHWSERVDLSNLKDDFIGKRHGVGVGVVENIRLNLGYRIVKPDRHIIGVMKNFLQVDIPPSGYSDFARLLGIDPRYFDCILFEYGKAKSISA